MNSLRKVGIVGCGVMGTGIAETCAQAGLDVRLVCSGPMSLGTSRIRLRDGLDRQVSRGKLGSTTRDEMLARITVTADLGALADRELVIEAITEKESAKLEVFAALNKVMAGRDAIIASNTSSIPITRLARVTERPERVVGIHFFNPVRAMPLVEVVPSMLTGDDTVRRVEEFLTGTLNKQVVRVRDRAGFVVNALLVPYLLNAVRMLEADYASGEDIDRAMTLGCGHPMGPLALADLIGLDTLAAIADALYAEFREPWYAVPPLLRRMVEAGRLGRKNGLGLRVPA